VTGDRRRDCFPGSNSAQAAPLSAARLRALRGEIQKGVGKAVAGELLDGPTVMEELRRELTKRKP